MKGKFFTQKEMERTQLDWGTTSRLSGPEVTGADQLVVLEVELKPGNGHNFHKHPRQEEVIYVLSGTIEQWIGQNKQILHAGDSAFIPADVVHASFNISKGQAKLLAILGPSIGEEGYEVVEVYEEAPWNGLR